MFEYDNELKLRSLDAWGFDVQSLDINKIMHVPMHQYRVANDKYPLLYIDNLQCCVGIYAYGDNFAFAAHVNPLVMRRDDYELDINGNPLRCRRIDDLMKEVEAKDISFLNIGISLGVVPLDKNHSNMKMIDDAIDNCVVELISKGIDAQKLPVMFNPDFILDSRNGAIILPIDSKKTI